VGPISEHTNARPHCSFQLGTTTQYGTTWLSVASSTDETGTVVQTLDYYPYGGTRISNSTSTNEKRKFIGQFSDDTGLSYLNARYYESARGQFISQDPSFLSVGDPNAVKQVTGQDQRAFLADPQLANSYNYGRDNPISNKDPLGLLALRFGAAGTIPGWALSGEIGVQVDFQGIEYYYGAGLAGGGGLSFGPQITTADLSHQYSVSTAVFAQGGAGVSLEVSKGMTYYPYSTKKPTPYQEATVGFPAAGLTGGAMAEVSGPIYTWNKSAAIDYSLPKPRMVNNLNAPQNKSPNSVQQGANYGRTSSGGASYSQAQVLSNLQSALIQLNAVLSTYKKQ
jgi:RHS repeat-associated protein